MNIPELLMPAGSLEKLKVAFLYGADAVYLGGQKFGLRAAADNFTEDELKLGMDFAREQNKRGQGKVYVVLNGFLHDQDLEELPEFLTFLESITVDAVIVSDLGVMKVVRENSQLPIHLSTQASCLNIESARFWKEMGAKRIIVGRELSVYETAEIKKQVDIEVESFIHGSMCMSYSGHCTISNYTQGRDSNRGGCAHSCRFQYGLELDAFGEKINKSSFFMSSKDLAGPELIPLFTDLGIDSVKVEGRMKGPLYVGTVARTYRQALDLYAQKKVLNSSELEQMHAELKKMSHREHTTGSLIEPAGRDSISDVREGEAGSRYLGQILEVVRGQFVLLEVKNHFFRGQKLEVVPFQGKTVEIKTDSMLSLDGTLVEKTKPATLVKLPYVEGIEKFNFVREIPCGQ